MLQLYKAIWHVSPMLRVELLYNTNFLLCICHENLQFYRNFHMNIHVNIIHDLLKVTTAQIPSFFGMTEQIAAYSKSGNIIRGVM